METRKGRETLGDSQSSLEEDLLMRFKYDKCCPLVKYITERLKNTQSEKTELEKNINERQTNIEQKIIFTNEVASEFFQYESCIMNSEELVGKRSMNLVEPEKLSYEESMKLIQHLLKKVEEEWSFAKKSYESESKRASGLIKDLKKERDKLYNAAALYRDEIVNLQRYMESAQKSIGVLETKMQKMYQELGDRSSVTLAKAFIDSVVERVQTPPAGWVMKLGFPDLQEANAGGISFVELVIVANEFFNRIESNLTRETPYKELYAAAIAQASTSIDENRSKLGVQLPIHFLQTAETLGKKHRDSSSDSKAYLVAGRLVAEGVQMLFSDSYKKTLRKMSTSGRM